MKLFYVLGLLVLSFPVFAQQQAKPELAKVKNVSDQYFDTTLEDPYRYMEDLEDNYVLTWMKSNANYANAVLNKIPGKQAMYDKLLELENRVSSNVYDVEITDNHTYFYLKETPDDETGKLYYRKGYDGKEVLLFDPLSYKKDTGLTYIIAGYTPSFDGQKVAVNMAANGTESGEVISVKINGDIYPEVLDRSWESGKWLEDNNHFLYTRFNSTDVTDVNRELNNKVYLHKIGTTEKEDVEVFSRSNNKEIPMDPKEIPMAYYDKVSKKYFGLIYTVDKKLKLLMCDDILKSKNNWKSLTTAKDEVTSFWESEKYMYYLSFKDASNFKILRSSMGTPEFSHAKVVVPEFENEVIKNMKVTLEGLYYTTMKNGVEAKLYFMPHDTLISRELKLPIQAGSIKMDIISQNKSDIWVVAGGWTTPNTRYFYDVKTDQFKLEPLTSPTAYPELKDVVVEEISVPSHDGVLIPVSIIHNKNIKLDGDNPTLLYGYGSYGISLQPRFSTVILGYLLFDGVIVMAHVRGGGELGDEWHKAGQKLNKPNTWKDAIAISEYLIAKKYTSPQKLSIEGASAGGILVGRAITERPDLFAAAVPAVGVMNPVRMEETPNGPVNAPEFGTVKDPEEFKGLLEMDAYHHLEKGTKYPATLITAGFNDPRVIAWQPAKFAAKMRATTASAKPVLFLTDYEGGHFSDTKSKMVTEFSNIFSFCLWQTGHPEFQPLEQLKN